MSRLIKVREIDTVTYKIVTYELCGNDIKALPADDPVVIRKRNSRCGLAISLAAKLGLIKKIAEEPA